MSERPDIGHMSSRKPSGIAAAWRAFGLVLAGMLTLAAAAPAPAAAAGFQRMVIAPGCYALAPGKSLEVPAYCLDQSMAPPASGAILANAPQSFGATLVKTAAGGGLTLQAALEQHLLQVEGAGSDARVSLRNLTESPLEICVTTPTVIMANGNYAIGDLPKLYEQIVGILAPAGPAAKEVAPNAEEKQLDEHARRQQALWDAVNAANNRNAEEEAYRALSHRILFGTVDEPGAAGASGSAPGRSKCSGQSNSVEICTSN